MLVIEECHHPIGIPLSIAPYDGLRTVGRTIVADDQSEREVCLLSENTFNRLRYEWLVIVRDDIYVNERGRSGIF